MNAGRGDAGWIQQETFCSAVVRFPVGCWYGTLVGPEDIGLRPRQGSRCQTLKGDLRHRPPGESQRESPLCPLRSSSFLFDNLHRDANQLLAGMDNHFRCHTLSPMTT
jgi:hypothetical protein